MSGKGAVPQSRRSVLILYTGGTFGMVAQGPLSSAPLKLPSLSPAGLKRAFIASVPELQSLAHCDVDVLFNRDSAHVGPDEWVAIARRIEAKWKDYDGVVILHGTDTLSYTASALSFLLRPCLKPVVLTGAQRPLSELRSDARRNLISAVEIAATPQPEALHQVLVFFDDRLFQGNRTRKRSATEFGAFESPLAPELARVGTEIEYLHETYEPSPLKRARSGKKAVSAIHPLEPVFNRKVALLSVTPAFPARALALGLLPNIDGLVLQVFPSGTAPTHEPEFLEFLNAARERKIPVVVVTGGAHPAMYAAGRLLLSAGCYWAGRMTAECAFVKTALLLGQPGGARAFARLWKRELAKEG